MSAFVGHLSAALFDFCSKLVIQNFLAPPRVASLRGGHECTMCDSAVSKTNHPRKRDKKIIKKKRGFGKTHLLNIQLDRTYNYCLSIEK